MKELYGYRCQLCNPDQPLPVVETLEGLNYVEIHQINQISDSKEEEKELILDNYANGVVVCSLQPASYGVYHKGGFKKVKRMVDGLYLVNNETKVKIHLNKHLTI